jgi:hypothetical protein
MPCPRCGKARRAFRVRKEGPNQGRLFLSCSDRECDSFEWADSRGKKEKVVVIHISRADYRPVPRKSER